MDSRLRGNDKHSIDDLIAFEDPGFAGPPPGLVETIGGTLLLSVACVLIPVSFGAPIAIAVLVIDWLITRRKFRD